MLEKVQTKLVEKQKEEIDLLKGLLDTERQEQALEVEKLRETVLKLAFLAAADCCKECCSKMDEKEI